jgi:multiple sugar transport system ATP-binding protein
MRSELIKLHGELQTTFIYVTHDQVEAMTMGDRIAILNDGVIQQVDTPGNIYHKPANMFVASFIGSPPMNFIKGIISDNGTFKVGEVALKLTDSLFGIAKNNNFLNKEVNLGIRPEHFSVERNDRQKLTVKTDLVEMLGSEKLVYFKLNGSSVIAKISPDTNVLMGDVLELSLEIDKAVLFDPETTDSILM